MNIPMLDLKAQYRSIQKEIDSKVAKVLESQMFILGAEVSALEKELSEYVGTAHAVGVSSGSDALIISLMALGIGRGDAVVTTPFTFFATAGAISRLGARPVFCDIDPVTYNLSPDKLQELLEIEMKKETGREIKAILPVHLYGQCTDMDPIMLLAEKYGLFVIEDAAQAIGSEYPAAKGIRKTCTFGNAGTLSFFPSKNLGGFGDGGMVLTDDEELAALLRKLRMHGSRNKYYYDVLGGNFRLDALQAAILRVKLNHLDDWQSKRRENAARYSDLFKSEGLIEKGSIQIPETVYKETGVENFHTFHQYVIRAKDRDRLQAHLKDRRVPSAVFYPLSLHLQECFDYLGYKKGDFPNSEDASTQVLALPIFPELTPEQQEYIVGAIAEFYK